MPKKDSIDKIVEVYLASVSVEPFVYKSKKFTPKKLIVSPLIFRDYTCPIQCGGCCPRFSLDYLKGDQFPYELENRTVTINNNEFTIFSDLQLDNTTNKCKNLCQNTGRCNIYETRPFSCDFELIRFITFKDKVYLTQKLFGRGWAMKRVDGKRGALCQMVAPNDHSTSEVVRKLKRLLRWANYFQIKTCLPQIIDWAERGPHEEKLILNNYKI